ncbi:hypothetical protein PB2503_10394 [Parvularcula bermudensis HTCC2503]|uniref:UDP-N-acetyl-alpha-D-muramoyl-L-alanyl-L-glutamate epimerase n=1 Tax=Parvularcula bermudensis (strain ATCC BAA-594 / HTCC2503 / KCTC 12087) TaxID=314260 RepID=E0TG11_PARBH|nr:hypothetical protein [Parvularcula bermudensis]ADM10130.1 hypothetical protein PB2503_10394 [Parvularcula bermudensis HTCC2503]
MTSSPLRGARFDILGWRLDPTDDRQVLADFYCDRHGHFTEGVRFPEATRPVAAAAAEAPALLTLLTIALGASYYKLAASPQLSLPPGGPAASRLAAALYGEGLAEFRVRAGLPFPDDLTLVEDTGPRPPQIAAPSKDQRARSSALVAFGGGKDSYVARRLMAKHGVPCRLASVVLSPAVRDVLIATAPTAPIFIWRRLDPRLSARTPLGFNGHIPITAINALCLALQAVLDGNREVIFANERSADEPTMVLEDGITANHQYSKSSAFELILQEAIAEAGAAAPAVFSILRPYSELWIGRAFAAETEAFPRFTSCNRNFRMAGDATQRWCGACPKCAFTSLILAPFLSETENRIAFGRQFLDLDALQPFYAQLLGLSDHKPWECVGTIAECRAALGLAARREDLSRTMAVQHFAPRLTGLQDPAELDALVDACLRPVASPTLPRTYRPTAEGGAL